MTDHTADGSTFVAAAEGEVAVPRKRVPAVAPLPGNDSFYPFLQLCGLFNAHYLLTLRLFICLVIIFQDINSHLHKHFVHRLTSFCFTDNATVAAAHQLDPDAVCICQRCFRLQQYGAVGNVLHCCYFILLHCYVVCMQIVFPRSVVPGSCF